MEAGALAIIGAGMQIVGALSSANAQASSARYNAAVADQNANIARQQAGADEAAFRRNFALKQASNRAAYGASGVTMEGSPLDVLESSAMNAEYDALNIRYKGELRALGYTNDAQVNRSRAGYAETAGYVSAGSALFNLGGRTGSKQSPAPVSEASRNYVRPYEGWE